jgi:hypothetical protein
MGREKIETLQKEHDSKVERIKAGHNSELEGRNAKYEQRIAELEREYALKLGKGEDEFGRLAKRILDDSNRFSEAEATVGAAIESLDSRLTNLKSIAPRIKAAMTTDKKLLDTLRARATEKDAE